jgi:hypothetical protein
VKTHLLIVAALLSGARLAAAADTPNAVLEASPEKGFRLSDKALQTLEVKTEPVQLQGQRAIVPAGALVYYQDHIAVYRLRDGWFRLIEVRLLSKSSDRATIETSGVKSGDLIATHGVPLLRVTQLEIESGAE